MTPEADYTKRDAAGFSQFEKNRFFKGKLMTPRDMEAEQTYHAERLHTLTRHVNGSGIVCGLEVRDVSETDDGLDVTVDAGFAIDGRGRPIVVEQVTTKTLPSPSTDEIHLFIQFSEVAVETVPVADTDGAIDSDAVANRTVEVFEFTHRETPPAETSVPSVDLSVVDPGDDSVETVARQLAEQYHETHRSEPADDADPAVFLGSFERTPSGNWEAMDDQFGRSFVYSPELLFALVVHHLTDDENPHRTPVRQEPEERPDGIEGIARRVGSLEETVTELEHERRTLVTYALRKTVKDRVRFFTTLSDRLEPHTGEGARIARDIAELSREDRKPTDDREQSYREQIDRLLDLLIELGEPLEEVTTEESLERYLKSVSRLQSALESDEPLLELIDAHDQVSEAADSIQILVDVVPED
ncbi:hypothetical protein C479_10985 [Halovivax asiaticus JCM 14624]|uniref:Uncharacterized protein n=1 Tax=Halovivax asiaticus JCM 14624 TaxID=1227490 RepID=M0BEM0_9EURY|nr:hypothetical protein [Halovivax asiaticus]ELZ09341.1 hypothetical protein C479_10985 [Halovivax asiaticus JCM 14624]